MTENPYQRLAQRLDALPQGFPPTDDGIELRVLARFFTPEEAALTAQLRLTLETAAEIADRIGADARELRPRLKDLARKKLITIGRAASGGGLGYGLMPFAVGIVEMQHDKIDVETARLFEEYYQKAFIHALTMDPPAHRVIPVHESVPTNMEIRPFESAVGIVESAKAWGVVDCLCRKQKALIGEPCDHPLDVCMTFSQKPGIFDHDPSIRAITKEESLATLQRAAEAGLVHSVSNSRLGSPHPVLGGEDQLWYICNCCTCSCGVLRGVAELGMANVVASSSFINTVDEELCTGCGLCVDECQFDALELEEVVHVIAMRCVGCGVCVVACPDEALALAQRPDDEIALPPLNEREWMAQRAAARGLDLADVL
jgi:electron transport complex protein RnfB